MKNKYETARLAGALAAILLIGAAAHAQQAASRSIEQVTDTLYRATNNNHHTVFLVTEDGIVLSDPINAEFSTWLKAELDRRFGAPVRYVVYSHHHGDHASGGTVFEDTAVFAGHENMLTRLALPADGTPMADSGVRVPDVTYSDRMAISLGGATVELIYAGDMTHGDDMSIVHFPGERTIFVVDWISLGRLPYRTLGDGMLNAWLNAIRFAEALDYEIVVGGHGNIGGKAEVAAFRAYLEDLRDEVAAGIAAGRSLEELQASIRMDRYRDWINYDEWRTLNIEGMHNMLSK